MKAYPHTKHFSDTHDNDFMNGMDLRDYFAAHAMQSYMSNHNTYEAVAKWSYQMADAMMKARNAK